MSEPSAIDVLPLTPASLRRPRRAVRGRRRPEVVLVHLLPGPRSRLVELDGRRQSGRARGARRARRSAPASSPIGTTAPSAGSASAPREDYERLATSKILAPLDDVPVWSIVCFVVSRRARRPGRRGGPPRRRDRLRPGPRRDDARGLPGRSRRANASRRRTPTTARSRCSSGPASRSSSAASGTPRRPVRPIVRLAL